MQNAEPHSYNFKFNGGWDNVYSFDTKHAIGYVVRFKPSADYVPPDEPWRDDLYELVIGVADDLLHRPFNAASFSATAPSDGSNFSAAW